MARCRESSATRGCERGDCPTTEAGWGAARRTDSSLQPSHGRELRELDSALHSLSREADEMECLRLRVKDVDFSRFEITVREGKGSKDRVTMLPSTVSNPLQSHLIRVKELHEADLEAGHGRVFLPDALSRKYPNADREWRWQWIFPARRFSVDPRSGITRRHHAHEKGLQRVLAQAARAAGLTKRVTSHTFRPLVRDAPPGGRLRHRDGAGVVRACGREDDDDLHARAEPSRFARGAKPGGPVVRRPRAVR